MHQGHAATFVVFFYNMYWGKSSSSNSSIRNMYHEL